MPSHSQWLPSRVQVSAWWRRASSLLLSVALLCALTGCPKSNPAPGRSQGKAEDKPADVTRSQAAPDEDGLANESPAAEPPGDASPAADAELVDRQTAKDSEPESDVPEDQPSEESPEELSGSWTTRRLIALGQKGPTVIDLSVSVGRKSLEEATAEATAAIADEILGDLEQPVTWSSLLNQPLVQSGWLGNLVPEEEQREQLISMYDTERDEVVGAEELGPFLSRGLARDAPLQISDIGSAPDEDVNASPWGMADQDNDNSLSADEMSAFASVVGRLDYNGDAIVSAQELEQAGSMSMQSNSMSRQSLLERSSLMVVEEVPEDDAKEAARITRKLASALLRHYTFLESVPRAQWQNWSDDQWQRLDVNDDQVLSTTEMMGIVSMEPHARLLVRFPALGDDESDVTVRSLAGSQSPGSSWNQSELGGQLMGNGYATLVRVTDSFSSLGRTQLRQRLNMALSDPQVKAFFTNQLQLQENAFDLLDVDGDETLSDEEFAKAWTWLSARQGTRLLARWMLAGKPWFQLADRDGDGRMTEIELQQLTKSLPGFDSSNDGQLTPNELPLVVRMELRRTDNRLDAGPLGLLGAAPAETADEDWFGAMDTNQDGFISGAEFLGSDDDFAGIDTDKDGFVSRREVYAGSTSY